MFDPDGLRGDLHSAWWGFIDAEGRKKLNSVVANATKQGYLPPCQPSFDDICMRIDLQFFRSILSNPHHVLHQLLPPVRQNHHNLRPRAHDRSIPDRRLTIGTDVIQPVEVVRDLGVYFDSHLTMKAHVARVARTCFYHLRRLRSIRRSLGREVTARLVSTLVISRLDCCNSVLAHLPASTLAPLQRVINAAARMVVDLEPRDHVTPALYELHWLPIAERIKFKLSLLVHHSINGRAPSYLTELVTSVANVPGRASLRSAGRHLAMIWSFRDQDWFRPSERFPLRHQKPGTVCPSTLD